MGVWVCGKRSLPVDNLLSSTLFSIKFHFFGLIFFFITNTLLSSEWLCTNSYSTKKLKPSLTKAPLRLCHPYMDTHSATYAQLYRRDEATNLHTHTHTPSVPRAQELVSIGKSISIPSHLSSYPLAQPHPPASPLLLPRTAASAASSCSQTQPEATLGGTFQHLHPPCAHLTPPKTIHLAKFFHRLAIPILTCRAASFAWFTLSCHTSASSPPPAAPAPGALR